MEDGDVNGENENDDGIRIQIWWPGASIWYMGYRLFNRVGNVEGSPTAQFIWPPHRGHTMILKIGESRTASAVEQNTVLFLVVRHDFFVRVVGLQLKILDDRT